jgi:small GTP-binding protein
MQSGQYRKICILGDICVGKTSLIRQFVERQFAEPYVSTVGATLHRSQSALAPHAPAASVTFLIWDLAGGYSREAPNRAYIYGAAGALLVCDLTRSASVENLTHYARSFLAINPRQPIVIVANKSDLVPPRAEHPRLHEIAAQFDAPWHYSSARTGEQVDFVFRQLERRIGISA